MIKMMEAACAKGAYGTKIVGSGGGGCFVALCSQDSTANVIKAIENVKARQAFSIQITTV
jgi:galactokinase